MTLTTALIVFEPEEAARQRLTLYGYTPEIAAEIAVYLAQSTDLRQFAEEIAAGLKAAGIQAEFVALDALSGWLATLAPERERTIVWAMTDGIRFYRGSSVPALARLEGFARFGSPATAAHLCQDKFASLALARAAGLPTPPTLLIEGETEVAALDGAALRGPLFVKPNTLGAKIGIFGDSLCRTLDEAKARAQRIWERYRDRALIQPFVAGDDIRVTFMDLGGPFADQLGIERIAKNPASETGGVFLTMKDNDTLSGARDTEGARGGFGAERAAAFTPRMIDLKGETDERSRRAVTHIAEAAIRLQRLLNLQDCFSIDFRVDADGEPTFFEFEVCPAVTIYDFQSYLARRGATLGGALATAMRLAFARAREAGEA